MKEQLKPNILRRWGVINRTNERRPSPFEEAKWLDMMVWAFHFQNGPWVLTFNKHSFKYTTSLHSYMWTCSNKEKTPQLPRKKKKRAKMLVLMLIIGHWVYKKKRKKNNLWKMTLCPMAIPMIFERWMPWLFWVHNFRLHEHLASMPSNTP